MEAFEGAHRCWTQVDGASPWTQRMPDSYARIGFTADPSKITLRTGDKREFEVTIFCNGTEVYMREGWTDFVAENDIKPFDVLVLSYDTLKFINVAILKVGGDEDKRNRGSLTDGRTSNWARRYANLQLNVPVIGGFHGLLHAQSSSSDPISPVERVGSHDGMLDVTSPWTVSDNEVDEFPYPYDDVSLLPPEEHLNDPDSQVLMAQTTRTQLELGDGSVNGRYALLELPIDFTGACLKFGLNEVVLKMGDSDGCKVMASVGQVRSRITYGWIDFVQKNDLQIGSKIELRVDPHNPREWVVERLI